MNEHQHCVLYAEGEVTERPYVENSAKCPKALEQGCKSPFDIIDLFGLFKAVL